MRQFVLIMIVIVLIVVAGGCCFVSHLHAIYTCKKAITLSPVVNYLIMDLM